MAVAVEPFVEVAVHAIGRRSDRRPDQARRLVEQAVPLGVGAYVVVVHAPNPVALCAGDGQVFRDRREQQRVDRTGGLSEAAVRLRLNRRELSLTGRTTRATTRTTRG